jgi:hypothetical protein
MQSRRLILQLAQLSPLTRYISKVCLTRGDIIGKSAESEARNGVEQLRQSLKSVLVLQFPVSFNSNTCLQSTGVSHMTLNLFHHGAGTEYLIGAIKRVAQ